MPRISPVTRDQLSEEDQQYHDAIVGTRGSVRGPFGVLLNSPKLAARVADTGAFVRFEFEQPESLKETLIIATAREMKQQYEFSAHARPGPAGWGVGRDHLGHRQRNRPGGTGGRRSAAGELRPRAAAQAPSQRRHLQGHDPTASASRTRCTSPCCAATTCWWPRFLTAFEVELGEGMDKEIPD